MNKTPLALLSVTLAMCLAASPRARAEADIDCKLKYELTGWSLIYKHTTGTGVVSCTNGQYRSVKVTAA